MYKYIAPCKGRALVWLSVPSLSMLIRRGTDFVRPWQSPSVANTPANTLYPFSASPPRGSPCQPPSVRALRCSCNWEQVDREYVSGAASLMAVGVHISNAYKNLTNVVLRIAPRSANSTKAVLINSHFDSVFGTPGENALFCWDVV